MSLSPESTRNARAVRCKSYFTLAFRCFTGKTRAQIGFSRTFHKDIRHGQRNSAVPQLPGRLRITPEVRDDPPDPRHNY